VIIKSFNLSESASDKMSAIASDFPIRVSLGAKYPFGIDDVEVSWHVNNIPGLSTLETFEFIIHGFFPFRPIQRSHGFRNSAWVESDGFGSSFRDSGRVGNFMSKVGSSDVVSNVPEFLGWFPNAFARHDEWIKWFGDNIVV